VSNALVTMDMMKDERKWLEELVREDSCWLDLGISRSDGGASRVRHGFANPCG